jgi:hypothetical protein
MKIEYNIEKIEDMYFDLQLTFKTRELESKIDFALIDDDIEKFVNFINKVHVSFINDHQAHYDESLSIHNDDGDTVVISYIKDTITIIHNLVKFYFKDIAKILLTFMEIKEYLEKKN